MKFTPSSETAKQEVLDYAIKELSDEVKNNSSNKRDRVLKSIMERYGGLWNLKSAMREDEDVVLVNLCDDLNDEFSEREVLEEIIAILK